MLTHRERTILGAIPDDWDVRPLRELLKRGECTSGDWGSDVGDTSLNVIRSTNFTNDGHFDLSDVAVRYFAADKAMQIDIRANDILLERSGGSPDQPVGRVLIAPLAMPGYGFGNFIQRLRPDPDLVVPGYLRWILHEVHRSGVIERLQYQTTQMRNLDYREYQRVLIPYPPTKEQERINRRIDQCDALILSLKRMLGLRGSVHRDDMQGPLNTLKTALLQNLLTGRERLREAVS